MKKAYEKPMLVTEKVTLGVFGSYNYSETPVLFKLFRRRKTRFF